jgi:hypothetical protein
MSNHLTCAKRAPLRSVVQQVRIVRRSIHLQSASANPNHLIVQTLHNLGWSKRDFVAAMSRKQKRTAYVQRFMCQRSVYPFM